MEQKVLECIVHQNYNVKVNKILLSLPPFWLGKRKRNIHSSNNQQRQQLAVARSNSRDTNRIEVALLSIQVHRIIIYVVLRNARYVHYLTPTCFPLRLVTTQLLTSLCLFATFLRRQKQQRYQLQRNAGSSINSRAQQRQK